MSNVTEPLSEDTKRWRKLYDQAVEEQPPKILWELIVELDHFLQVEHEIENLESTSAAQCEHESGRRCI